MIDLVIIAFLGLLLMRGWTRGFVREAMDLVGLLLGTLLAFRLAPLMGAIIGAVFGASDEVARLIGGFVIFFAVGIGAAFATREVERRAHMPGLNLVNRAGGAGLAAAWGTFLATLILTMGVVLPMPPAVANSIDDSAIAQRLTDPDGVAQSVFTGLAGDRIIETMLELRDVVGTRKVVVDPGSTVEIPPADPEDLERSTEDARAIHELVNEARAREGLQPLSWDAEVAEVAHGHAREMYLEGYFAHQSPTTGTVGDRLQASGISYSVAGENLALAATVNEVHTGLMDSPGHRANILSDAYHRIGIAVVRGPLGLMTVQVFTG